MPEPIDSVAQAIQKLDATGGWPWEKLSDAARDLYRRMARAAIDALGLTEEWRCVGWVFTRDEDAAQKQHAANGGEIHSRLVTGWVRKDNTNA
nr:hypothetical protein [Mycobacterium gordonae]